MSCRVFKSLYPGKMDMIDAHLAHNPFTGIFELEILAKLAKLFSDVLQCSSEGVEGRHETSPFRPVLI